MGVLREAVGGKAEIRAQMLALFCLAATGTPAQRFVERTLASVDEPVFARTSAVRVIAEFVVFVWILGRCKEIH